jgi:hypothetical protein
MTATGELIRWTYDFLSDAFSAGTTHVCRRALALRLSTGSPFPIGHNRSRQRAFPEGPDGLFRVVYWFENEKLVELINRTVHAAALSALVESANDRFYFAVYVRSVGRLTPFYMAAIDPF